MNISDYLRTALLNHALGVSPYAEPTTIWAGLFTTLPPTSGSAGTEVITGDYARVQVTWGAASTGVILNSVTLRFPTIGVTASNWGSILGLGLFDAPTTGNLLFFGGVSAPVSLSSGTSFSLSSGSLEVTLS